MKLSFSVRCAFVCTWLVLAAMVGSSAGQATGQEPFVPQVGQAGKDVVWVPTPEVLVEKMLDMAKVTSDDFVVDLGSGDGRNVIAAAKRGARALGVEFNPDMVALSRKSAASQNVSSRAVFVQGDMFEADISQATVLALFLLPDNLDRLVPKFLALKPGTRIVGNTFGPPGWTADETERVGGECVSWCTSLLWIVPAQVGGRWRLADGELRLDQTFQMVAGNLTRGGNAQTLSDGRLRGETITFTAGGVTHTGRVNGDSMEGTTSAGGRWSATRIR